MSNPKSALVNARKFCRLLMDAVHDAILIFDARSFVLLDVNKAAAAIYGYSREQLIGKELRELTHEVPNYSDLFRGLHSMERTDFSRSNEKLEFLVSLSLIDYFGRKAVLSINRDIRERRKIEHAVANAERRCRAVVDNVSDIVTLTDARGIIDFISPQAERVLGYSPQEVKGKNVFDYIHPDDRPRAFTEYEKTVQAPGPAVPSVLRFRSASGHWIPLEVVASNQIHVPEVGAVIFTARDLRFRREAERAIDASNADLERRVEERITQYAKVSAALRIENQQRRYVEHQLQESLSLLQATLESTADGILVISNQRIVSSCNQKFLDMWQIPRMDVVGLRDQELLSIGLRQVHNPEDFLRDITALYENPAAVSFDVLTLKDSRIFERYSQPQTIGDRIVGRVWSFRDVTNTKRLEEELRQSHKMEAVGRLSGGVAHDFNNLLVLISGYANQILEDKSLPQRHREAGEQLLEAIGRAASFTRQLLAFSRKSPVLPVVTDLNQVVSDIQRLLKRLLPENIQIVSHFSDEPLPVYADPSQIELAIMNLAINARDAMPNGGVLSMTLSHETAPGNDRARLLPGTSDLVLLTVSDTGIGMSQEIKRHLFEPFFTTKEPGKGTGLGLSTVHGIVEQAGGCITVESEPNEGATFRVYLPRSTARVGEKPKAQKARPTAGHETILLAEDEPGIRTMTRGYLESLGYKVLEAGSGREALQISRLYQGGIDLLVTDVGMAEMRGDELVRSMRKQRTGIAAIFISGQAGAEDLDPQISLVQKPFTFPELGVAVRTVLDKSRQRAKRAKPPTRKSA